MYQLDTAKFGISDRRAWLSHSQMAGEHFCLYLIDYFIVLLLNFC